MGGSKELTAAQAELFDACRRGEYEKVRAWFAAKKNKRPKTPLSIFRPSTPPNWLSNIRDPSTQYTVLHYSALNGREQISKLLIDFEPALASAKDKRGCIPLHLAAWNGHLSICKMLIQLDPNSVDMANSAQETSLHLAAQHGHSAVVQLLLQKHADASTRNARHESPLDIACRMGHAPVVTVITSYCPELALQAKVDASSTEENSTGTARILYPMHVAARYSHVDCMRILKSAGFDINFITEEGSALHVAARFGQIGAVKFLLEEGINQNLLDCRGMTSLDVLAEVESQRVSDLTQIIQSRSYWSECRRMIEQDVLKNGDTTYSSSDSGIDRRDLTASEMHQQRRGANGAPNNRFVDQDRDIVWQRLPETSDALIRSQYRHEYNEQNITTPTSHHSNNVYRPPSIMAEFNFLNDQDSIIYGEVGRHQFDYDAKSMGRLPSQSLANRSPPNANSINRTWNSRIMDTKGTPKFPSTCPHMKAPPRMGGTLPTNVNGAQQANSNTRTRPSPPRGTILPQNGECVYKAPPNYDAWAATTQTHLNSFPTETKTSTAPSYNSAKPYDNVPKNLLVYDNAPPPGHKRWDHFCSLDRSHGHAIIDKSIVDTEATESDGVNGFDGSLVIASGVCTLPVGKPKKRPSLASMTNCAPIKESSPATTSQDGIAIERECSKEKEKSPNTPLLERDASASMTYSNYLANREGSKTSSNLTFSTLEKSASPPSKSDEVNHPNGRAPLALPEELTASTTNSIISSSLTPERERHSTSVDLRSDITTINQPTASSTLNDTQQSTSTMRLLRESGESNETGTSLTPPSMSSLSIDKDPPSPNTSQHIIFQYCAKLHQDTSANNKAQLPFSPSGTEYSDSTVASSCSLPMISNISTTPPSVASPKKSLPGHEADAQLPWSFDVRFRHPKNVIEMPHGILRNGDSSKSIDLEEEWKKIDDIIASYGAAACRESVFERDYLQKVAVFLRDRSSKALTVLNTRPNSSESRNIPVFQMETTDWLIRLFGVADEEAQHIGAKLCQLGYDKYTQMKGSLTREVMTEVGMKEEIKDKIMRYLEHTNDPRPNANHFNYVSDWLCSLELTEYLSNFFEAGYKSMGIVMGAKITEEILKEMTITKPGHISRILYSLQQAAEETRKWAHEQGQEIIHSPRPNENTHSKERNLIHGSVTFSAHYLGSSEVSNVDQTVESRNAMAKLKKEVFDISRTSPVTLEISTAGVSVWEPGSEFATMEHPLGCIAIVCQDAKDLNCFAYISQESHTHFAHVFCVLTADCASEIIYTLGTAFNLAHANMEDRLGM